MATRLWEALEARRVGTSVISVSPGSGPMSTLGQAGFDCVIIDLMFAETTWHDAADMVRAGQLKDLTMLVRVQGEPWFVTDNQQMVVDAGRALSIGAEGVLFSVSTRREVEGMLHVAGEWHRNLAVIPFDRESFDAHVERLRERTLMVPLIESPPSFEHMEDILSVPGLKAAMIGTTDAAVSLGHGVNSEHPDVWALVDRARELCSANDVKLWINTAMGYADSFETMLDRAGRLVDHGADIVLFQTPELLLQMAGTHIVSSFRGRQASGAGAG